MKRANGGPAWFLLAVVFFLSWCSGKELADPALHFSSRFICEGHRKNLGWFNSLRQHSGNAVGKDTRFPCARTRKNQYRSVDCSDGSRLFRV